MIDFVKTGGIIAILIPYHSSLIQKLISLRKKRWIMLCPPEHLNFYSKKFLKNFFEKNGFNLEKVLYLAGGMFNPFKSFPKLKPLFTYFMNRYVDRSLMNRIPVFDHMFLYFKKND